MITQAMAKGRRGERPSEVEGQSDYSAVEGARPGQCLPRPGKLVAETGALKPLMIMPDPAIV